MPIAFHVVARQHLLRRGKGSTAGGVQLYVPSSRDGRFTSMLTRGMFERYPRLRCAVLEAGSNWITAWLDRMDHKFEVMRAFSPMKLLPSEYFKRQCLISAEPDESITAQIIEHLGADYVIWASDYPHLDASFNVVGQLRQRIAHLPAASQRKVLGENAVRFYGLSR
jgi:predicted TIM-barrel fold metal-dependent hydrolase